MAFQVHKQHKLQDQIEQLAYDWAIEDVTEYYGVEELTELSLELLHAINKPNKENMGKICDEIKDVEKYLNLVKERCNEKL